MQIFRPYESLSKSASCLDDSRLNKQILECAQIASTGFWINDCMLGETLTAKFAYLPSHEHHPICVWSGQNALHMSQVVLYGLLCVNEKHLRKSNAFEHKSLSVLVQLLPYVDSMKDLSAPVPQPNVTKHFSKEKDLFEAYRKELTYKWLTDEKVPDWSGTIIPNFFYELKDNVL